MNHYRTHLTRSARGADYGFALPDLDPEPPLHQDRGVADKIRLLTVLLDAGAKTQASDLAIIDITKRLIRAKGEGRFVPQDDSRIVELMEAFSAQ